MQWEIQNVVNTDGSLFDSYEARVRVSKTGVRREYDEYSIGIPVEIARFLNLKGGELLQVAIRRIPQSRWSQPQNGLTPPRRDPSARTSRKRGKKRERPRLGNSESTRRRQTA